MYMYTPKHENYARARVEEVNASFKDLCAVCDSVRGMKVTDAINFLRLAASGRVPILYRRHNKKMGHRRELGGKKGRWPMKEARIILKLLNSAVANAEQKGLIEEDLVITHIAANKQRSYARLAPRGRWRRAFYETAFAEVVLEEMPPEDEVKEKMASRSNKPKTEKIKKTEPRLGPAKTETKEAEKTEENGKKGKKNEKKETKENR